MSEPWLPSPHSAESGGLQGRVARGLTWTVVDIWGRQILNLVIFVVLARLLTPVDFGLVALATVFVAFAQLLVDQGLGDALIQRRDITRGHVDTAFWVAMGTGILLSAVGLFSAGPLASALSEPHLAPILRVLSLTFVLAAMSSIQIALLRRELAFRSLAVRAIAATVGGGVVGVGMAVAGTGAWALVGQQVISAIVSVVALWWVSPWSPRFHFSRRQFADLFPFGAHVVGSDILSFLSRNTDNLLIGIFLGTTPLGLYAVGYRILDVSQTMLINIARKITFPAFSRLQDDRERMRRAYFRVTRLAGLIILPGYIGLALVAPQLTPMVFGPRWEASGVVASVLFLIGPVLSVQAFSDTLLNAAGHPEVVFRFRIITAVTNVVGFLLAVPFGILAVAAAFVARGYLLMPLMLYWMRIYAGVPAAEYLVQLRGILVATAAMAVPVLGVLLLVDRGPVALALAVIAGGITFMAVLWRVDRRLLRDALVTGRQAISRSESPSQRDETASV
jgi:O-antigen/teichoic acid export membrane protein